MITSPKILFSRVNHLPPLYNPTKYIFKRKYTQNILTIPQQKYVKTKLTNPKTTNCDYFYVCDSCIIPFYKHLPVSEIRL